MRYNDGPSRMPYNQDRNPRRHDNMYPDKRERTPPHFHHNNQGSPNYQDNNMPPQVHRRQFPPQGDDFRRSHSPQQPGGRPDPPPFNRRNFNEFHNNRHGDFPPMDRVPPNLMDEPPRNMPPNNRMMGPHDDQFRGPHNQGDRFRNQEPFRDQRDAPFRDEPFRGPGPNDQRFDGPQSGFRGPNNQFRGPPPQNFMRGPQMPNPQQQPIIEEPVRPQNQMQEPIRPQNPIQEPMRPIPSIQDGPPVFAVPTTAASKQISQPRPIDEGLFILTVRVVFTTK